jgi:hypothetical protein
VDRLGKDIVGRTDDDVVLALLDGVSLWIHYRVGQWYHHRQDGYCVQDFMDLVNHLLAKAGRYTLDHYERGIVVFQHGGIKFVYLKDGIPITVFSCSGNEFAGKK